MSKPLPGKLPYVRLSRLSGVAGGEENLREHGRDARLLFLPHRGCIPCDEYVGMLAGAVPALRDWDARVLTVLPAGETARGRALAAMAPTLTLLEDSETGPSVRERTEVSPGSAALLVADRFGEVWHGYDMGAGHVFPTVPELEAWLRFLATQCPE